MDELEDSKLLQWLDRKQIDPSKAEATALAMLARLTHNPAERRWEYRDQGGGLRTYTNLRAVFKVWVLNDSQSSPNGSLNSSQSVEVTDYPLLV